MSVVSEACLYAVLLWAVTWVNGSLNWILSESSIKDKHGCCRIYLRLMIPIMHVVEAELCSAGAQIAASNQRTLLSSKREANRFLSDRLVFLQVNQKTHHFMNTTGTALDA